MSIAGDVIREFRMEKGLSQTDLAARCPGVDISLISRFENGRTENPSREALMQILNGLELHPLEFARRCRSNELKGDSDTGVFRIGWGHCIWGAPLIIPIYESASKDNSLKGISLSSYGVYDDEDNLTPYRYNPTHQRKQSVQRGPSYAHCFDVDQSTISLNAETWCSKELKTFTADDIQALYRNGQIDGMVVPNTMARAYAENHPDLMRCASMMFTGEACTFLVLWKDRSGDIEPPESELSQKYRPFRRFIGRQQDLQLTVFFARGTVAEVQLEDHMKDLVSAVRGKNPNAQIRPKEIDLGNWNRGEGAFMHQFAKEFEHRGVACFLGWEPHITWAIKEIRGYFEDDRSGRETASSGSASRNSAGAHYYEVELRELLAHLDPQFISTSHHPIQFDMVVSQSAFGAGGNVTKKRVEDLQRFFTSISHATSLIERAQNQYNRNVQYIASYLDMPPDRCFDALRKLSFSLWYHPEWFEFTRRLLVDKPPEIQ